MTDHYGAVNNHFPVYKAIFRMVTINQPTEQTNTRVILEQVCSCPVRRQSFAKFQMKKIHNAEKNTKRHKIKMQTKIKTQKVSFLLLYHHHNTDDGLKAPMFFSHLRPEALCTVDNLLLFLRRPPLSLYDQWLYSLKVCPDLAPAFSIHRPLEELWGGETQTKLERFCNQLTLK